jgi:hypothetical protein
MSGAICTECSSPYLRHVGDKKEKGEIYQCEICGWKGDISNMPRVWLSEEGQQQSQEDYELKKAGKLFFIRISIKGKNKDDASDAIFTIMSLLGVSGASTGGEGALRTMRVRVSQKPSDELMKKIQEVKGVTEVTVF